MLVPANSIGVEEEVGFQILEYLYLTGMVYLPCGPVWCCRDFLFVVVWKCNVALMSRTSLFIAFMNWYL